MSFSSASRAEVLQRVSNPKINTCRLLNYSSTLESKSNRTKVYFQWLMMNITSPVGQSRLLYHSPKSTLVHNREHLMPDDLPSTFTLPLDDLSSCSYCVCRHNISLSDMQIAMQIAGLSLESTNHFGFNDIMISVAASAAQQSKVCGLFHTALLHYEVKWIFRPLGATSRASDFVSILYLFTLTCVFCSDLMVF